MRRRTVVLAAGLGLLVLALWLRPPPVAESAPEAERVVVQAPAHAPVRRTVQATPDQEEEPVQSDLPAAASGELGIAIRNRICALCQNGGLEDEACERCPSKPGPYGRIVLDVVGEDGRPLAPHEAGIGTDCGNAAVVGSGEMDLPVGTCTLTAHRVDGLLTVVGESVEVEITENGEAYATVTVPTEPWGAAGVDLDLRDDGVVVVRRLIEGTAVGDSIPVGSEILDVDGAVVAELSVQEVARELNGPVGSTVTVRFRDPDTGAIQTVQVERSRLDNRTVAPDMVPG